MQRLQGSWHRLRSRLRTTARRISYVGEISDENVEPTSLITRWISDKDGELGPGTISSSGAVNFTYSGFSTGSLILT